MNAVDQSRKATRLDTADEYPELPIAGTVEQLMEMADNTDLSLNAQGEAMNVIQAIQSGVPNDPTIYLQSIRIDNARTYEAARRKAKEVVEELRKMKLSAAAKKVEDSIEETLTFMDFPSQHWTRIRTNNTLERLNREIKRRTRAIGAFPDGNSALMLVCARLRHVAGSDWGIKRYMNMDHLLEMDMELSAD